MRPKDQGPPLALPQGPPGGRGDRVPPLHTLSQLYPLPSHTSKRILEDVAAKHTYNLERFFQALGDNTRLRLLNLMKDQEVCVCYFVEILGGPQPKVSRHLAYLRKSGIVEARREGKWMHYRIVAPPHAGAADILRQTLDTLKEEKQMQMDRARLTKACCAPSKYPLLEGAPVPMPVAALREVC